MKKVVGAVCLTVALASTVPFYANAASSETVEEEISENQIKILVDQPELMIYQYKEDGVIYENHENIKIEGNKETINVVVYKIENDNKNEVENNTVIVTEIQEDLLEVEGEDGEKTLIETKENKSDMMTRAATGGSYIADVRYKTYSDGSAYAIMNGESPYYKNTKKSNPNFIRFQGHANGLKSKEKDLVTFGIASLADDIIKAVKAGKVLSLSFVKKLVSGVVKTGPIGAALTLYSYGNEWLGARADYRKI
jgi:hypothetical protein